MGNEIRLNKELFVIKVRYAIQMIRLVSYFGNVFRGVMKTVKNKDIEINSENGSSIGDKKEVELQKKVNDNDNEVTSVEDEEDMENNVDVNVQVKVLKKMSSLDLDIEMNEFGKIDKKV